MRVCGLYDGDRYPALHRVGRIVSFSFNALKTEPLAAVDIYRTSPPLYHAPDRRVRRDYLLLSSLTLITEEEYISATVMLALRSNTTS